MSESQPVQPEQPASDLPLCPAIILAAGASTRLGQPKQFLRLPRFGDEALLDRAVRLAREAGAAPIFVVLGAFAESIQTSAKLSHCTVVTNADWEEGMASSLRAGVRAVSEQKPLALGALILACDQPALTTAHLRFLLAAHRATPDHVIASEYVGSSGIPAVIPQEMFPAISKLTGDQGARVILQQASRINTIAFANGERDLDLPEDLRFWMEEPSPDSAADQD